VKLTLTLTLVKLTLLTLTVLTLVTTADRRQRCREAD